MESNTQNAQALASEVRDLVTMPEVYLRVQALMNDLEATLVDFTEIVQTDPGISARVLQMANSAFFGYGRKVESISFAINLMGIAQLHDLVLATAVVNSFSKLPGAMIDMATFWRRSIRCGVLSRMLAEECDILSSERLFVGGLLNDIGHLILYLRRPVSATDAIRASLEESRPLFETERDRLGYHYGDVGAAWMDAWQFPANLVAVCRDHCEPALDKQQALDTAIVHVARQYSLLGDSSATADQFIADTSELALQQLDIEGARLDEIQAQAGQFVDELVSLLVPRRAA